MPNDEIINYIKSELARGENREAIISSLSRAGWQNNDIQEAFNAISASISSVATPPQFTNELVTEKDYPITKLWIFKLPIIFVVISIVVWSPDLAILSPILLIANLLIRANFHYSTEDKFLVVRQGVFSKKQRNLPYGVIQNVFVKQDVFDRIFGLASLRIENASQAGGKGFFSGNKSFLGLKLSRTYQQQDEALGSSGNKVNIPGLKKSSAESLKAIILQRMKENPIEELGL